MVANVAIMGDIMTATSIIYTVGSWLKDIRNKQYQLSVFPRPKPLASGFEEVKGHQAGVSGQPKIDQHSHSIKECFQKL